MRSPKHDPIPAGCFRLTIKVPHETTAVIDVPNRHAMILAPIIEEDAKRRLAVLAQMTLAAGDGDAGS